MKRINRKEIFSRAGKTFVQAVLASLAANLTVLAESFGEGGEVKSILVSIAIGALAAGLSAVWNGAISPLLAQGIKDSSKDKNTK